MARPIPSIMEAMMPERAEGIEPRIRVCQREALAPALSTKIPAPYDSKTFMMNVRQGYPPCSKSG